MQPPPDGDVEARGPMYASDSGVTRAKEHDIGSKLSGPDA